MAVTKGDRAPDIELPGIEDGVRRIHALAEHRGRPVVLVFYPGDNTPVCTRQLNAYTADVARFGEVGAQVLAISPDSVDSHEGFADAQGGFAFPLLADESKAVAEAYGVLGPMGYYRRCVFVVDGDGVIRYVHRGYAGSTFRSTDEILDAVRLAEAPLS